MENKISTRNTQNQVRLSSPPLFLHFSSQKHNDDEAVFFFFFLSPSSQTTTFQYFCFDFPYNFAHSYFYSNFPYAIQRNSRN
ncbi:hypothetical protein AtEden1_Chr5g0118411 [Arabidopsis thaliana]